MTDELFKQKLRQMQEAVDADVARSMFEPMHPESPIAKAMSALSGYLQDEADLLAGKPVALKDGRVAVRLPIPFDAFAVFKPLSLDDIRSDLLRQDAAQR